MTVQRKKGALAPWLTAAVVLSLAVAAAAPAFVAIAPVRKSGALTTSLRCFMFGSSGEVVNSDSPRRRRVRSMVTNALRKSPRTA